MKTWANGIKQCGSVGTEAAVLLALVVVLGIAGVRAIGSSTLSKLNDATTSMAAGCRVEGSPSAKPSEGDTELGGSRGTC